VPRFRGVMYLPNDADGVVPSGHFRPVRVVVPSCVLHCVVVARHWIILLRAKTRRGRQAFPAHLAGYLAAFDAATPHYGKTLSLPLAERRLDLADTEDKRAKAGQRLRVIETVPRIR
jgi:hypothetical protein